MMMRLWAIPLAFVALALAAFAAAVFAENIDPNNDMSQYAWSENAGWINAEPANCSNCGVQVRAADLTGYMWGENVGWISMSCKNSYGYYCTGSPGGTWGVNRSYSGALSGYAWSENSGWINMSCTNNYGASCTGSPGGTWGVSISPATGVFSGRGWSDNKGWITFSAMSPVAYQVQTTNDFDADTIINNVDNCPFWSNTAQALPSWPIPAGDSDCDGFPDSVLAGGKAGETYIGTDPSKSCAETPGANNDPLPDTNPMDFNDDRIFNGQDSGKFGGPFGSFNKHVSDGPFAGIPGERFNFNGDAAGVINGQDTGKYQAYFNKTCVP